ncbi:thiopeptide-type bacteriocin biosynthesis protein [Kitasatospora sp. NPDC051170]|uniref:thiopeptide-type bacteriocin biosynthesis protein n=1 Tax=Kitasatospora sp. NPDC051170 TaxID=3364056 RepID=UPI00379D9FBA
MNRHTERPYLERAILAVLTGTDTARAAAQLGIDAADLATAAETYRTAGRAAIASPPDSWAHVNIRPTDWHSAEATMAAHLAPMLCDAEARGTLISWWYVRKHPYWRLRLQTACLALRTHLAQEMARLQSQGVIASWSPGIYEPETAALGGPLGINAAHALFHADSRALLTEHHQPETPRLGRRELSILMCSVMLRAAGQEWTEQGDVWTRVAAMRPTPAGLPESDTAGIRALLSADTLAMAEPGQALHGEADRIHAFARAGHELADIALRGSLTRGLRDVLAHMIAFHWNRVAIPTPHQAILARTARDHILGAPPYSTASAPSLSPRTTPRC